MKSVHLRNCIKHFKVFVMNTICIQTQKGEQFLYVQNIVRIQASSNYCKIYCNHQQYPITVAKILQWFQNNLPATAFVRTHRTHLVNKSFIQKLETNNIVLLNGERVTISRRRKINCSLTA
jgi:two-component system, LytTR family, response regulator